MGAARSVVVAPAAVGMQLPVLHVGALLQLLHPLAADVGAATETAAAAVVAAVSVSA